MDKDFIVYHDPYSEEEIKRLADKARELSAALKAMVALRASESEWRTKSSGGMR